MSKFLQFFCMSLFVLYIGGCQTNTCNYIEQKSVSADANVRLGIAFLREGAMQNAKEKLLLAEKLDAKNPVVCYCLGYYYETTGNLEQARKFYIKAIHVAPNDGASHNNYGAFLCRRGEYEESLKQLLLAVQDKQYLETAQAYENAGLCCLKIPDQQKAKNFFLKALAQDPNLASSQFYLAELSYAQQDYLEAKNFLNQQALVSHPSQQTRQLVKKVAGKLHDKTLLELYRLNS